MKTKVKLILDDAFELPFKLPIFRCIGDDGQDTCVYKDTYKSEPIYVGIARQNGGRIDVKCRNSDHRSFIENLPKDSFIERRVVATLSREDAEYLESYLIRLYGRKVMGGSLLNWCEGIEKSATRKIGRERSKPMGTFRASLLGIHADFGS
jgi:hypothetical protein